MSPTLKVRITEDLDLAIGKAANRRRTSKAEWVRATLERTLGEDTVVGDALDRRDLLKGSTADLEQMLERIESARD